jgi:hypothetical protein
VVATGGLVLLSQAWSLSWGFVKINVTAAWQVVFVSCLVHPGFQDVCKVTAGENGSEKRIERIQHGGWISNFYPVFS